MTAGPITTKLEVAQCQKCQQYVFQSQVSGCLTMVDVLKLADIQEWREALVAGKSLYIASEMNGKPYKLSPVFAKQIGMIKDSGHWLYATHGCAAAGTVRATKVEAPPAGPQRAPVTPGGPVAGFRRATAPAGGSQGPSNKITTEGSSVTLHSRAANASPRPSRCIICRNLLTGKEPGVTAIEYNGRIIWGFHEH